MYCKVNEQEYNPSLLSKDSTGAGERSTEFLHAGLYLVLELPFGGPSTTIAGRRARVASPSQPRRSR